MERIIEYPLQQNCVVEISTTDPALPEGYCICYQYDVTPDGYGPYGFETEKAKTLLHQIFEPLIYWNNTRQKLIDTTIPQGSGLFLKKDQVYVKYLEYELSNYYQKTAIRKLREKYKKHTSAKTTYTAPLLQSISQDGKIPASVISNLIENECEFFLGEIEINTGGLHLAFFDVATKEKIKIHAKAIGVDYHVLKSIEELKAW